MADVEIDGVRLFYEQSGEGLPEFVFVPGWCCDRTAFQPQIDYFAATHAVTALDLRGCGLSDRPEEGYGIPNLADDVAGVCAAAGITKPIVIGHSLGGMIAVELAARHPEVPGALVLVDPGPIDWLPQTLKAYESLADQMQGPSGEDVRRLYVGDMGARDPELGGWIVEMMCKVPLPVATAVIRGAVEWNGAGALALCDVPTLLLRSRLDADTDVLRLCAIKPDIEVGITVGAGHFHQLEVPDQINAMIERFLACSL